MTKKALVLDQRRFAVSTQTKILAAHGYDEVFGDFDEALQSIRKGEMLGCADLRAFGTSHREIAAGLMRLHDKGCAAVHAATGRNSMQHGPALFSEALIAIHNDRRTAEMSAKKIGQLGQEASIKARQRGKRPRDDCKAIWHNTRRYETHEEAIEAINDGFEPRSRSWLYDEFGPR